MSIKEKIMAATIEVFNEKGLKFTMDDLALQLQMSKKTIYTVFNTKEDLFLETVRHGFRQIKRVEKGILEDPHLTRTEKIERIIIAFPEEYKKVDWSKLYVMQSKYPKIYKEFESHLNQGWEDTLNLLEEAIAAKEIKPISIPILKMMIEGAMSHFLSGGYLLDYDILYYDALEEMMKIIMKGITA